MIKTDLPLVLYGAGKRASAELDFVKKQGMNPVCFCDADITKHNTMLYELPIVSLEQAKNKYGEFEVFITLNFATRDEIIQYLLEQGIEKKRIINGPWKHYESYLLLESDLILAHAYVISYHQIKGWACSLKGGGGGGVNGSFMGGKEKILATNRATRKGVCLFNSQKGKT
ncbi:MAG: hypothetical protein LBC85_04395, partial [Fibromonadaceae bacterium]|nr:hypothetical protein [Fibromonadaceae bacterium]